MKDLYHFEKMFSGIAHRSDKLVLLFVLVIVFIYGCSPNSTTVKSLQSPAANQSSLPRLVSDTEGHLFMSWIETDSTQEDMAVLRYAELNGNHWTETSTVASGDNWFVNWADFPSVTFSSGQPQTAHWLQNVSGGPYAYHVKVTVADDQGQWSESFSPHFDNTATEHGFVSMVPWSDDLTLAVWLDGRKTANRKEGEYFDLSKAMTVRSALIAGDGSVTSRKLIDETVCDCCQTALAKTSDGALAAYRNRTENEIRDIYISRYTGGEWSEPVAVHDDGWKIGACPVNGPALAANDSMAVVAWYTGAGDQPRVKAAISYDGGATFSDPIMVSNSKPLGRVDAEIGHDGTAFVSWMERATGAEKSELRVLALSPEGKPSGSKKIAAMGLSRRSGFPQMKRHGQNLIFAWTDVSDEVSRVRVATISSNFWKQN